jgi:hypothetical protein
MSEKRPQLARVFQAAAEGRHDVPLAALDDRVLAWAVETGLGPLVFDVTRDDPAREAASAWPRIHSAHLTARLIAATQAEATAQILDGCTARACAVTLLKGISIAHQHYPEPALRPMRDIDILVGEADVAAAEAVLTDLGYRQRSRQPARFYEQHHHTMPFVHPRRGVWVEVHRALASPKGGRARADVLTADRVGANIEPARFQGRPTARLTSELQLVYLASHWAAGFRAVGGAIALVDAIYLLRTTSGALQWDAVLGWLDDAPAAAGHLYALLGYLQSRRIAHLPPGLLGDLRRRQRAFGRINLAIVHAIIDRVLLSRAPAGRLLSPDRVRNGWNALFLPRAPVRNLAGLPWALLPRRPR